MPISPESFNRIRESGEQYGAAREAVGIARAIAEAAPSEANQTAVAKAEAEADKARSKFLKAVGAAKVLLPPTIP